MLSGVQIFYHAINNIKIELAPEQKGCCRLCGGPLIAGPELFSKYNWSTWNNDNFSKRRDSIYVCGACLEARSCRKIQNTAKAGFAVSLSRGFEPFKDAGDAVEVLKNLPEPPFALAFMPKYTRIPVAPYLEANYFAEGEICVLAFFGTSRDMYIKIGPKTRKVSPIAPEIYSFFVSPGELLEKTFFCKQNKTLLVNTQPFKSACESDPEWALAAWLAGFKNKEVYKTKEKKDITIASEGILKKDWLLPEEDKAWQDL
jgi:hypothetical protein